jgi:hypothetical protein
MNKLLFLLPMILFLSVKSFASFPVTAENAKTELVTIALEDNINTEIETPVSRIDWGLFAFCYFLGFLGVHRFILGDTWIGIFQLLTFGGLYIWWIIDIVKILTGKLSR